MRGSLGKLGKSKFRLQPPARVILSKAVFRHEHSHRYRPRFAVYLCLRGATSCHLEQIENSFRFWKPLCAATGAKCRSFFSRPEIQTALVEVPLSMSKPHSSRHKPRARARIAPRMASEAACGAAWGHIYLPGVKLAVAGEALARL